MGRVGLLSLKLKENEIHVPSRSLHWYNHFSNEHEVEESNFDNLDEVELINNDIVAQPAMRVQITLRIFSIITRR